MAIIINTPIYTLINYISSENEGGRGLMVMALDCGARGHEQFDKWFDGRASHSRFTLQISLCASRFMTSEVDGDGNDWTGIYGDASTKKEARIGSS